MMRNLTAAFFLTFIFCVVSATGNVFAKGSATSSLMSVKVKSRSFRDTFWDGKLKEWKTRHGVIPQRLPHAVDGFKLHKQSSSRHYRSSHSHRGRHVRHGRTHTRRRSRR